MHPAIRTTSALGAVLFVAACATTTFTSTWKAPDATSIDPAGRRVAAVYISTDESSRRVAEDILVRKLEEQGAEGIASYTMIERSEVGNMEAVRQKFRDAMIDAVVTMRVVDEKERTRVVYGTPGPLWTPYYSRFGGYWGYGWAAPYSPTEVTTTTVLRIETLVYSLDRDALLWAGTSRTTDPANVAKLVEEVADSATKRMIKEGLLEEPRMRSASASEGADAQGSSHSSAR